MASDVPLDPYAAELYCHEEMPTDEEIKESVKEFQQQQMQELDSDFTLPPSVINTPPSPEKSILSIQYRKN